MAVSNYIPSSRVMQPGVCTSSTRPASPYTGMTIYETDTNRMYVWNGTAWVIPNQTTQNPEGLELVSSLTISSSTSAFYFGTFSSTYDSYRLVYSGITTSGGAANGLVCQLATTGSPANGTNYYGSYVISTPSGLSSSLGTRDRIYLADSSAGVTMAGVADFFNPYLTQYTQIYSTAYMGRTDISSVGFTQLHQLNNSYTTLYVFTTNAITAGQFNLYGYRKS